MIIDSCTISGAVIALTMIIVLFYLVKREHPASDKR
jgi:hypothetical protein